MRTVDVPQQLEHKHANQKAIGPNPAGCWPFFFYFLSNQNEVSFLNQVPKGRASLLKMWMLKMGQLWTSFLITIWWHLFLTTRQNSKLDWLSGRPSIINTAAALQFFLFNQHQFSGKAEPLTFYNSKSSHCVYHWWWRPIELEQP